MYDVADDAAQNDPTSEDSRNAELKQLLLAAFESAKRTRKDGWQQMTFAVLKNRLLQLTDRQFTEQRYGVESVRQLLALVPDLVIIEEEGGHNIVRLRSEDSLTPPKHFQPELQQVAPIHKPGQPTKAVRIRDDLWKAILNYDSDEFYVWDPEKQIARPKVVTDIDLPVMPTVTPVDLSSWRRDFASIQPGSTATAELVSTWATGRGKTTDLPRHLRGQWLEHLKESVIQRLSEWFKTNEIPAPSDLTLAAQNRSAVPDAMGIEDVVETRRLRGSVMQVVNKMTHEELERLTLPMSAIIRAFPPGSTS